MERVKPITINGEKLVTVAQEYLRNKYHFSRLAKGCRFCRFFDEESDSRCSVPIGMATHCRTPENPVVFLDKKRYVDYVRKHNNPYMIP